MAVFRYVAIDAFGKETKGVLEGDSPLQIRQRLRSQQLVPLDVEQAKEKNAGKSKRINLFQRKIKSADLSLLTYQFATLLDAGLPVEEALYNMAEQADKPYLKTILLGVHAGVLEGKSLASSMDEYPGSFPQLYRASVNAGEQSGQLGNVLHRLAGYLEKQQEVQSKVQQALIYPSLLTVVALGIVVFLLTFVVPKIVSVFVNTGATLPTITILLLTISDWAHRFGWIVLLVLIGGGILFKQLLKQEQFRYGFHAVLMRLPVIGHTIKEVNCARFARTFGILFAASVPVLDAMKAANSIVKMLPMQRAIAKNIEKVREGTAINKALEDTGYFSLLSVRLIASGEMSGKLEMMLEKSAEYQERMVARKIDVALALFEPLMIMLMGSIVLFIVLAILLPIFEINQLVG